jgi:anti-anti-sigma factor
MPGTYLDIRESQDSGRLKLSLAGELDLASTPVLEDRLTRLRVKKRSVLLDLSEVEFIDSTGLRLLIRAYGDARSNGWQLQIQNDVSVTVARLFKLVHFNPFDSSPPPEAEPS